MFTWFISSPEDLQCRGVRSRAAVLSHTWALYLPLLLESAFVAFNNCDSITKSH